MTNQTEKTNITRYTQRDKDGRWYIEGANGKLENDTHGRTYGAAIDRLAVLENVDVDKLIAEAKSQFIEEIFEELDKIFKDSNMAEYSKELGCVVRWNFDKYKFLKGLTELKNKHAKRKENNDEG